MAEFINTIDVLGDDAVIDSIIQRTITEFKDDVITNLAANAFYGCNKLDTVSLPSVTNVPDACFYNCASLKTIDIPAATTIGSTNRFSGVGAFYGCKALESVHFPKVVNVGTSTFSECRALTEVYLPEANAIYTTAFNWCSSIAKLEIPKVETIYERILYNAYQGGLTILDMPSAKLIYGDAIRGSGINHLVLRNPSVVCSFNGTTFNGANSTYAPNIYVPASLLDTYKSATNWSLYADYFRILEDYTVDGTITGELDETKI